MRDLSIRFQRVIVLCAGGALFGLTGCIPPNPRYMSASVEPRVEAPADTTPEAAPFIDDSLSTEGEVLSTTSDSGSRASTNRIDDISFSEAFDSTEGSEAAHSHLMEVVNSYLGVPYHDGGTTRRGMDCSGFVTAVYREVYQVLLPRSSRDMFTTGQAVPSIDMARTGDLVFFHNRRRVINHVGIYVGDGKFAHASSSLGVTITAMDADYFGTHFSGIRRVVQD